MDKLLLPRPGRLRLLVIALTLAASARGAVACDICAIYTATEQRESRTGLRLGIAEQYTHFGTERLGGTEISLPATEYADSSITQFLVGYAFDPRFGVQLNIPFVSRTFRRIEDHRTETGSEIGLGDLSVLGSFNAFSLITEDVVFRSTLLAGVKFPTGDASRLGEEFVTTGTAGGPARAAGRAAGRAASGRRAAAGILPLEGGLHGHDLALGSGSYDGIVGGQLFWSWHRVFATAGMQYAIRSGGSFDYRFANDLTWTGGPGYFVLLGHDYSVGLQAALSGETKGYDTQQGRTATDTAMTALYVGPGVNATWGTSLATEVAVDLPVIQHNTGLQLVPDVRVRGGVTWRF